MAGGHGRSSIVIHSDSTSAIARASQTGAGPGQKHALEISRRVSKLRIRTADIVWVKGHSGVPGNERADKLAGEAAEKLGPYTAMSLAYLKLCISNRLRKAKRYSMPPLTTMERRRSLLRPQRNPCWTRPGTRSLEWQPRSGRDTGARRCIYTGSASVPTTSASSARTRSK